METKKHGVMSKFQEVYSIQFLEDHPELKSGKLTQNFTFKKAQALWQEVAAALNAMPGSKKEWEKWLAIEGHHIFESQAVFLEKADSSQEQNHDEKKEVLKGNSEQDASKNSEIKLDEAAKKNSAIKSRHTHVQRLNNTLAVSERMIAQMEQKTTIPRNYFTRKLPIMKTDVIVEKRISALEIIARSFQNGEDDERNKISP
ncbi:hypothetical protein JTB14_031853 [Gonioctena quinquepunctata]|nr:hypothetical protein JTB14_031853 [Gonioctena quinquepunctata]